MLKKAALVSDFPLNLVSLACLEDQGYDWSHKSGEIRTKESRIIGTTVRSGNNFEIGNTGRFLATALSTLAVKPRDKIRTSKPRRKNQWQRLAAPASPDTWHRRMGHIGPLGLHKLGKECLGVSLRSGKSMAQCPHCALSKMTQQISRLLPANKSTRSFHRVYIDWLDLDEGWDSYQGDGALVRRVMIAVCKATGMAMTYFTQSSKESENLPLITDFVTFLALRYNLEVKVIRSDNELNRIQTRAWCKSVGISLELCAPDTHAQNGGAERFGRLIIEKARAMRLSGNLPHKLWREIVGTAGYLYNRTPRQSNDWKSPYEAFHTFVFEQEAISGPRKPQLHHLKAYGCKAYVLIKSKSDRPGRLRKLNARAHIGFLVGYESTNIYRIWIPHKRKVISARDVIFNKDEVWDQKPIRLSPAEIQELDEAVELVEVPPTDE